MKRLVEKGIYEFEGFRLDARHLMLYKHGEEVLLPPKAVETLIALVERHGAIVAKDELMSLIWSDAVVEESNLALYLHLLRKTLGERADKTPFIETLRRRGYRFTADVKLIDAAAADDTGFAIIGREREIAGVAELLLSSDIRLVILTGVGGVGKTTLARAVARRMSDRFADGVFFIELAGITSPEMIASAIAAPLDVKTNGSKPLIDALKEHLAAREVLLILDNFEQLIAGAGQITDLLAASAAAKILVTSRIQLRLSTGHEFVVPALAVPSPRSSHASEVREQIEEISAYPAVRLLTERVRGVKPNFELTAENAPDIAEICARLEGLPLAIELAAARIKTMSPATILEKLEHQLKLLTGGPRDLPLRQQTMSETIAWSYDLLDASEKRLFARLAVFIGGFDLKAAEAVCAPADPDDAGFEVFDGIESLVDHNLLVLREQGKGDPRFQMLEVVREYAMEILTTSGERDAVERSHAEYYCSLGDRAEPHLEAAQSAEWLNRLEADHNNLRAALGWAKEKDASLGQRLAGAIWRFWWLHGYIREGCDELALFLSLPTENNDFRAKMLSGASQLNRLCGETETACGYAEQLLALARETGDKKSAAMALNQLGFSALDRAEYERAELYFCEGILIVEQLGDRQMLGLLTNALGEVWRLRAVYDRAAHFYQRSLKYNREIGDLVRQTTNLINLGTTALLQGNIEAAGSYYREGLKISSKMVNIHGTLYCLEGIAGSYFAVRRPETAAVIFGAAEALRRGNNLVIEPADILPYEQGLNFARSRLTGQLFDELFAKGQKINIEEAVSLALSDV